MGIDEEMVEIGVDDKCSGLKEKEETVKERALGKGHRHFIRKWRGREEKEKEAENGIVG